MPREFDPIPPSMLTLDADDSLFMRMLGDTYNHIQDIRLQYEESTVGLYASRLALALTLFDADDANKDLVEASSLMTFEGISSSNLSDCHRQELLSHILIEIDFPNALNRLDSQIEHHAEANEIGAYGNNLFPELKRITKVLSLSFEENTAEHVQPPRTMDYAMVASGITAVSIHKTWLNMHQHITDAIMKDAKLALQHLKPADF